MSEEPPAAEPTQARSARRWWLIVSVVAVALATAGLIMGQRDDGSGTGGAGGGQAQDFELPVLGGDGTVSLASFRGQPVVVNFFAAWCAPCKRELPALQEVAAKLEGRVAFVGIDHQDSERAALQLLRDVGVTYPAGYDPEGKVATSYGLFGMPTTLFVAPDGRLLEKHTGELSREQLERAIGRHFGV